MAGTHYQLLKDNESIALGSMAHCLDVFYWEIYYGYNHLAYSILPFRQDAEVYHKAKAWDKYIAEVRERARFTENTEDDIELETKKVVDYFMEDE